jgi:hypothetical protein
MAPLSWHVVAGVLGASIGFALVLDQIKRPVMAAFKVTSGGPAYALSVVALPAAGDGTAILF